MKSLKLFIPGDPIPQGRPRACLLRRHAGAPIVSIYDPPECDRYKKQIRTLAQLAIKRELPGWQPLAGPLSISLTFYLNRAREVGEKKKVVISEGKYPTTRADIDNLIKASLDGLTGVIWDDDRSIIEISGAAKLYADGREPGFEIIVRPYGQEEFDPAQEKLNLEHRGPLAEGKDG